MFQNFAPWTMNLRASYLSYHVTSRACSLETSFGYMEIHLSTFMMIQNIVSNLDISKSLQFCLFHLFTTTPCSFFEFIKTQRGKSPIQVSKLSNYIEDVTKIQPCAILKLLK